MEVELMNPMINEIKISKTYGGYIEGSMERINRHLLKQLDKRKREMSSYRPLHIISPQTAENGSYPLYMIDLWLVGELFEWNRGGSCLQLIAFSDLDGGIDSVVNELIEGLDWEALAMDYDD